MAYPDFKFELVAANHFPSCSRIVQSIWEQYKLWVKDSMVTKNRVFLHSGLRVEWDDILIFNADVYSIEFNSRLYCINFSGNLTISLDIRLHING